MGIKLIPACQYLFICGLVFTLNQSIPTRIWLSKHKTWFCSFTLSSPPYFLLAFKVNKSDTRIVCIVQICKIFTLKCTSDSCNRASWGSDFMICLTPNKAGNFATSDSESSDREYWSCTDRDWNQITIIICRVSKINFFDKYNWSRKNIIQAKNTRNFNVLSII